MPGFLGGAYDEMRHPLFRFRTADECRLGALRVGKLRCAQTGNRLKATLVAAGLINMAIMNSGPSVRSNALHPARRCRRAPKSPASFRSVSGSWSPPADVASRILVVRGSRMKANRAMDGVSSDSRSSTSACGRVSCGSDEVVGIEHVQLTVRLSRDRQAVSA
jgi:hypothetical protein